VAESAAGPGPSAGRARDVLEALRTVVGFDCAALSFRDPSEGRLRTLAKIGYADRFDEATGLPEYRAEHARLHMLTPNRPLRFSDLPCGGASTFSATELAWPAGLRGGLGMALYARDGRETGFLTVNTIGADGLDDGERDAVALLGGVLGEVSDVLGALAVRFRGRVLLTGAGSIVPLPGAGEHPVLRGDSPAVELLRRLVREGVVASTFLWRSPSTRRWHRIELVPVADPSAAGCVAAARVDAVGCPYDLTPRELEVLTLVARGCANREIADRLIVSRGTVRTHVERVLAKLGATSRTEAAVRAIAEGLLVWVGGQPPPPPARPGGKSVM
jgi:DNA-binding CsgD family transcriptional regulator